MERDWRTPQQEGREELSSPQAPKFAQEKDYGKSSYDFGKEHGVKKKPSGRREVPNNHPFSFFPPVPPPKDSLDFLPPPPPPPPPCVWPP
ncbi:leiomodin-2-like [Oncorhynchus clarkii lewisi]|uniref:leiomodin-2-like n=1 Tax=Oncorhynchus clarkii lewisi TaxID=490388 RepID=UPI0039B88D0F